MVLYLEPVGGFVLKKIKKCVIKKSYPALN